MTSESRGETVESLDDVVNRVAALLERARSALTEGDVASLRRMDPRRPCTSFFKLAGLALDDQLRTSAERREDIETRWAVITVGLAHLGDFHAPEVPLGRALATLGYSELRLDRLLRSDADRLVDELPMLSRFLAAKGVAANWGDAARLILSSGRSDEEKARRSLARNFFSALATADN